MVKRHLNPRPRRRLGDVLEVIRWRRRALRARARGHHTAAGLARREAVRARLTGR